MADTMAGVIERLGVEAKIPKDVTSPLVTKLKARAPSTDVMDTTIALIKKMPAVLAQVYAKQTKPT